MFAELNTYYLLSQPFMYSINHSFMHYSCVPQASTVHQAPREALDMLYQMKPVGTDKKVADVRLCSFPSILMSRGIQPRISELPMT